MIELAPHHKIGLPLANPILIAAGFGGYGDAYRHLLDLSSFGALVTNPITLRPQRGAPQPRLVEIERGLILNTGDQNPGVKKVIRHYSKIWRGLAIPIIAHLPGDDPDDLRRTARALAGTDALAGLELGLPRDVRLSEVRGWVEAIRAGCLLPLLIKLPLEAGLDLLEAVVEARPDALVVGAPPGGAAAAPASGALLRGDLYSPVLHHLALHQIDLLAGQIDLPLIAAGGVHSPAEAEALLAAGAVAVQLDTLLWLDPARAGAVARQFGS